MSHGRYNLSFVQAQVLAAVIHEGRVVAPYMISSATHLAPSIIHEAIRQLIAMGLLTTHGKDLVTITGEGNRVFTLAKTAIFLPGLIREVSVSPTPSSSNLSEAELDQAIDNKIATLQRERIE